MLEKFTFSIKNRINVVRLGFNNVFIRIMPIWQTDSKMKEFLLTYSTEIDNYVPLKQLVFK